MCNKQGGPTGDGQQVQGEQSGHIFWTHLLVLPTALEIFSIFRKDILDLKLLAFAFLATLYSSELTRNSISAEIFSSSVQFEGNWRPI